MENAYLGATPVYGQFHRQVIIGDGSTTQFDLDYSVGSSAQVLVSLDGVIQEPVYSYSAYSSSGQGIIVFTEPPDANARIFVTFFGQELTTVLVADGTVTNSKLNLTYISAQIIYGDDSTASFTLNENDYDVNSILVFYNGVCLEPITDYSVSGTQLTFTFTPLLNSEIMIRFLPI